MHDTRNFLLKENNFVKLQVILCGGTSKIPKLKSSVSGLFTQCNPEVEVLSSLSPDEVLAMGAASQASLLTEAIQTVIGHFGPFLNLALNILGQTNEDLWSP